jgi:muramoyltetrapeptide carboxypeptidase
LGKLAGFIKFIPETAVFFQLLIMKRKKFIGGLMAATGIPVFARAMVKGAVQMESGYPVNIIPKIPPYLKKGDTIGICCPAGFITAEEILPAVLKLKEWGFEIKTGSSVGKRDFTFGGTDEERLMDFQQMLDDKTIKAILCARGGYGSVRIIDKMDFTKFVLQPKWIVGFSDVTVLHSHLIKNFGIASIHSKMCNSFPGDWAKADAMQIETIDSINKCLLGQKMKYTFMANENNRQGKASGTLTGGNLKTIETLAGSKSDIGTEGKILFVEDTGEYLYSIDRMFWNLKRSGKLDKLAGLIIGGFKIKPADTPEEEFGKNIYDIVLEKTKQYKYPVCFDFPVGHQKNNFALKCGVKHNLMVDAAGCALWEN